MNKLGGYHNEERSHYNFSFSDNEGKHVTVSFGAEPDYDLDTIFNEFRNFLIATGHDVEGQIGELFHEEDEWEDNPLEEQNRAYREAAVQNFQHPRDKFSMDHLPNNGWPFGGLTSQPLPTITSLDLSAIKTVDLSSFNQYPTMAPITQEQIKSWRIDAPGTMGSAELSFKQEENDWSPRSKDYRA
jgi:hypothetical protein